jgi:PAS domain S-box-containing protein
LHVRQSTSARNAGVAPEELVGKVFNVNAHSEELVKLPRDALSGSLMAGTTEFEMQRRDGRWRWLRCSASQLLNSENELVGVVACFRDVTDAQQKEQQLLHSERLAAMGQMVDGFAHELNNPLTAIMGGVELLDAKRLDESSVRHLQLLKQQVRRAAEIVQNLLFFSRPPAPGKTRVNVNELIQRTLMLHQYSLRLNNISVDFIPDSAAPPFEADANQLMQVFLNLIVNAEQAIREVRDRGTIRVRIGHSPFELRVTFQDDGPGISSESVPKIFDPFYSTKRPGRGLGMGLSVAMAIVKSFDGKIEFTPAPGGGAAFTITLPLGRAASAHSAN